MDKYEMKQQHLQNHLSLIRRSLGWSADKLGKEIGVTRQTINNFERSYTQLSKTHYLAIRYCLEQYINSSSQDTLITQNLLEVLVDDYDKYTEEEREKIIKKAEMMAACMTSETVEKSYLSNEWKDFIKALGLVGLGAMLAVSTKKTQKNK